MNKKTEKNRKDLWLTIALVGVLVAGLVFACFVLFGEKKADQSEDCKTVACMAGRDSEKGTDGPVFGGEDTELPTKDDNKDKPSGVDNPEDLGTASDGRAKIAVTLTYADTKDGKIVASGFAATNDASGKCTYVLTSPSGKIYEFGDIGVGRNANSVTCYEGTFDMTTKGNWTVFLRYETEKESGQSNKMEVQL
jgi:hypothetical protein